MKRRRIPLRIVLMILSVALAYYILGVISTYSVMVDIKDSSTKQKAELGYDNPLVGFGIEKEDSGFLKKTTEIKRIFTWVYGNKGKVWIHCKDKTRFSSGEKISVPNFITIVIEKKDGKWKVIKCISLP